MPKEIYAPFDAADYLKTDAEIAAFLAAAAEGGPEYHAKALEIADRARRANLITGEQR